MPKPLTAKVAGAPSVVEQAILVIAIGAPGAGLWYCFSHDRQIHFDDPRLNLAAQAGVVLLPLCWGLLFYLKPVVYESSDEDIVLGNVNRFNRLPASWWVLFMTWAAPVFAVVELGRAILNRYLPHAQELSTSPGRALFLMVIIFCLAVFYLTMLMSRSDIPPRVSNEGLRTGILRFHKWEDIHHVSRHKHLYAVYHRVNPALPATSLYIRSPEFQAIWERYLSEHHIQISNDPDPAYRLTKIAVVLGFTANLLFAFWLRGNTALSLVSIVLISFGIGIAMTMVLEKYRGVSKYGKYKPVIQFDETAEPDSNQP